MVGRHRRYLEGYVMATQSIRRRLAAAALSALLSVAVGSTVASAASPSAPTRGDAQAVFEASFTGGGSIRAHNPLAEGVPGVPIEPTPDSVWIIPLSGVSGTEYCQEGWHVVTLGFFDDPALFPGGEQELRELLSAITVEFILDGVPLETESTVIKRVQHPSFSEVPLIGLNFGAFLPPGSLSLGLHTLSAEAQDPARGVFFSDQVEFTVIAC
jgi:hypothetical protein